ncbi:hypothetical protein D3OALGA1CA_5875 [Olavius algarvensis associated proteobacterium Delta 3]|nr:hypothetical protein D3OALGB2SA_1200 [Olavius algarvensis associated proteobacterium Delta 3]CAB5173079.1 hypothetical protein D3OALGA1CA_5875 [Olavius algarvensis associated proteobacterium Delta 3]
MKETEPVEETALKQSMVGALLLSVWGLVMAFFSDSGAVLLDGMYNLVSAIMTFFSLHITRLVSGRETRDFPLGYFMFESLFVFIKGSTIIIVVLMALWSSLRVLLAGGREPALGLMTGYVVVAVIGCGLLYWKTRDGYRNTGSEILMAEAQGWLLNAIVTGAIGVAFVITLFIQDTAFGWIARYVDQILVILLSLVFIRDPILLMLGGLKELLLAAPQREFAAPFHDALVPVMESAGARGMSLEVLKTGRRAWLTVKLDPAGNTIDVDAFMELKRRFRELAGTVHPNTDTEVVIERPLKM